jgi:hypothetical protein
LNGMAAGRPGALSRPYLKSGRDALQFEWIDRLVRPGWVFPA